MHLRNLAILFSILFIGIFLSVPEHVFSGGRNAEDMEIALAQKAAAAAAQTLSTCQSACASQSAAGCTQCTTAPCSGISTITSSSEYTNCKNLSSCQKACASQSATGCTQCTTAPCSRISTITSSDEYQTCKEALAAAAQAAQTLSTCQSACASQSAAGCTQCTTAPCSGISTITSSDEYQTCRQAQAAETAAAQALASCKADCNNNTNCSSCLDPTTCTNTLGANAASIQASCNTCVNACSGSKDCDTCTNSSNNCGVVSIPTVSSGYTQCKSQLQQEQNTAALLTQCQGLCGNGSTAGSNCSACLSQCTNVSGVSAGVQACNTLLSCQAYCTTGSGGNCSQCVDGCGSVAAVATGYQACQTAQATASKLLTSCQTNCTTGSGGNCSHCISQCGGVSAVSSGYQACQAQATQTAQLLSSCRSACSTGSGGNCSQCLTNCSSISSNSAVSSGYQACQAQATQTAQLLSSCTSACSTGSGGNCSNCLENCKSISSNSAVSGGYNLCLAQASCENSCVSAAGNPTNCQTQCLSNPNCSSLAGVQLSQSDYPGLYACQQAVSSQTSCTAACSSNNCVACLACSSIPGIAATTGYNNCISTQSCQSSCKSLNTYDACLGQCFNTQSCQSQGITIAAAASTQIENISWLQGCLGTLSTYDQCLNVCNLKTLDCGQCISSACEGIAEIKSSAGFQSCNSCSTACANASQAAGSTDAQWAQCKTCKTACNNESMTTSTPGVPPAFGFCSNSTNAWTDCNTGCATAAALPSSTATAQIASACNTCMSSNACQVALNSSSVGAWGGVTIPDQYTNLTTCQKATSTAAQWTACNNGCTENTVQGCTNCLTPGTSVASASSCSAVGLTPANVGNFELQPAYANLKNCQNTLNTLNTCGAACSGAPANASTASNSSSWANCGGCTKTCSAQNILPGASGAPLALGVCNTTSYLASCDAGCASAVTNKSLSQCQACVNQMPACQLGGIESGATLSSTSTPFTVPAANTNLATCQQWMLTNQSLSQCDSGCANAVTLDACNSCIDNKTCQAPGVGITSSNALVAMPASSLVGYKNIIGCQNIFSNIAACISACTNAPATSSVAPSSPAWANCSSCVSACSKVGITSTSPGAPVGLQACSTTNSLSICDSGCATANTSQSLSGCNSCISNNPACAAAGISSTTAFQAMTVPATSSNPLTNLLGCQTLMLNSQLLSACDAACKGQTTAAACSTAISTNASCQNKRISTTIQTAAGINSSSYPNLATCQNLLQGIGGCVSACANAPATATTASTDVSWGNCTGCLAGCKGILPTTTGAPAALGVCSNNQNFFTACDTGCLNSTTTTACTTCLSAPACTAAQITPVNILGLNLANTLKNLMACQSTLQASQSSADWTTCNNGCPSDPTVDTCIACLANTVCHTIQVTTTTLASSKVTIQDNYPLLQGCAKALNTNNCTTACSKVPASASILPTDPTWDNWQNCPNCTEVCSAGDISQFSLEAPVGLTVCTPNNYVAACNTNCAAVAAQDPTDSLKIAGLCNTCLKDPVCSSSTMAGITASGLQNGTITAVTIANAPNLRTCQNALSSISQCQGQGQQGGTSATGCLGAGTDYNSCQSMCINGDLCNAAGISASNIVTLAEESAFTWLNNCAVAQNAGNSCSSACQTAAGTAGATGPILHTVATACLSNCFPSAGCTMIGLNLTTAGSFPNINGATTCQYHVSGQQSACANACKTGNCATCLSPECSLFISNTDKNYNNCYNGYVSCANQTGTPVSQTNATTISNILGLCTLSNGVATVNNNYSGCKTACAFPTALTYAWAEACYNACSNVLEANPQSLAAKPSLISQSAQNIASGNQTIAPYYQAAALIYKSCQAANGSLSASNSSDITAAVNTCTACYNGINGIPGMQTSSILNTNDFMPAQCNGLVTTSANCAATCSNATSGNPALTVSGNSLGITSTQMCAACPANYTTGLTNVNSCLQQLAGINPNAANIPINNFSSVCAGGQIKSVYQACPTSNGECSYPGAFNYQNYISGEYNFVSINWARECTNACKSVAAENPALLAGSPSIQPGQSANNYYQAALAIEQQLSQLGSSPTQASCTNAYNALMKVSGLADALNAGNVGNYQGSPYGNNTGPIMPSSCYMLYPNPIFCSASCSWAMNEQAATEYGFTYDAMLALCKQCPNDPNYGVVTSCIESAYNNVGPINSTNNNFTQNNCNTVINACSPYMNNTNQRSNVGLVINSILSSCQAAAKGWQEAEKYSYTFPDGAVGQISCGVACEASTGAAVGMTSSNGVIFIYPNNDTGMATVTTPIGNTYSFSKCYLCMVACDPILATDQRGYPYLNSVSPSAASQYSNCTNTAWDRAPQLIS